MDMIYFPVDYPKEKWPRSPDPLICVHLQPAKKQPDSCRYQHFAKCNSSIMRRTGGWASTKQPKPSFKPAAVNGKIAAGALHHVLHPYPDKWKYHFNSNPSAGDCTWTRSKTSETEVPVSKAGTTAEYFTMSFHASTDGATWWWNGWSENRSPDQLPWLPFF